ncbi:hypothetical protein OG589_12230 [Sphaerisporangium sp. NBC_01403]|uniref:hypothetical protein n=1 Tax=Sphaerisporangium sp. NBC_01403 TaxID=2903599 RepID=UPI0032528A4F
MRREWEPEELIAAWTLLDGDWELVGNKMRMCWPGGWRTKSLGSGEPQGRAF